MGIYIYPTEELRGWSVSTRTGSTFALWDNSHGASNRVGGKTYKEQSFRNCESAPTSTKTRRSWRHQDHPQPRQIYWCSL